MVAQVMVIDIKGTTTATASESESLVDSTKRLERDSHIMSTSNATSGLDALAASAALEERMEPGAPDALDEDDDSKHRAAALPLNNHETIPAKAAKTSATGYGGVVSASGGMRRSLPFSENHILHQSHQSRTHPHYWSAHSGHPDGFVAVTAADRSSPDGILKQASSSYNVSRRPPVAHPMHILPTAAELKIGGCTCKKSRCLKLYCQCFASSTTCGANCKCTTCHNTTLHAEAIERARLAILQRNPAAFDKGHHVGSFVVNSNHSNIATTPGMLHRDHRSPWSHSVGSSASPGTATSSASHWSSSLYSPATFRSASTDAANAPPASSQDAFIPAHRIGKRYGCKCKRSFCLKKYCECFQNAAHCDLTCRCTNCKNVAPKKSESSSLTPNTNNNKTTTSKPDSAAEASSSQSQRRQEIEKQVDRVQSERENHNSDHQQQEARHDLHQQTQHVHEDDDQMAMLAAVAMTELVRREASSSSLITSPSTQVATVADAKPITPEESKPVRLVEIQESAPPQPQDRTALQDRLKKRRLEQDPEERRVPIKKRKPPTPILEDDEEVKAVVSSTCNLSIESRNPSPISSVRSPSYYPTPGRFPYDAMGQQQPQHVYMPHVYGHPGAAGMCRSPPPPYHHHPRASPPPFHPHHHPPPHHHHHQLHYPYPVNAHRSSPLTIYPPPPPPLPPPPTTATPRVSPPGSMRSSPSLQHRQHSSPSCLPTYEELMRTSGLPKSLSFRKICSKCGKTRGEHGDLGFGNKCVYQECGKCGAGQHVHEKAGQPMGISCSLTVAQGARPGAAAEYNRRIRELAARADLQREINNNMHSMKHSCSSGSIPHSIITTSKTEQ